MIGSTASKVVWVARATLFLVGLAVTAVLLALWADPAGADLVPGSLLYLCRGSGSSRVLTYTPRLRLASRKAASVIARAPLTRTNRFR